MIEETGEEVNLVQKRLDQDRQVDLFEIVYTDFTEIEYANDRRKVKLMPTIGDMRQNSFWDGPWQNKEEERLRFVHGRMPNEPSPDVGSVRKG